MILSDKQLTISVREFHGLRDELDQMRIRSPAEAREKAAEVLSLRSRMIKLKKDIRAYRSLRRGTVKDVSCNALEDLPSLLVKARIMSHVTQSELARALGAVPQQIQRYESTGYAGVGLGKVIEISRVLGIKVTAKFELEEKK